MAGAPTPTRRTARSWSGIGRAGRSPSGSGSSRMAPSTRASSGTTSRTGRGCGCSPTVTSSRASTRRRSSPTATTTRLRTTRRTPSRRRTRRCGATSSTATASPSTAASWPRRTSTTSELARARAAGRRFNWGADAAMPRTSGAPTGRSRPCVPAAARHTGATQFWPLTCTSCPSSCMTSGTIPPSQRQCRVPAEARDRGPRGPPRPRRAQWGGRAGELATSRPPARWSSAGRCWQSCGSYAGLWAGHLRPEAALARRPRSRSSTPAAITSKRGG
mmetsp:Transcript_63931/g.176715  ORF Transcript_63931/g.176715 Transcript_63931/m.176715 type:complete len:275 (+) Transcript_63931:540-1364(+)